VGRWGYAVGMRRGLLLLILGVLAALPAAPARSAPDDDAAAKREKAEREFRGRVDKAITNGAAYVALMQQDNGTWTHTYDGHFPGGVTALCMLALLESECNPWSEEVVKGLKAMMAANLNRTYTAALGIMAMESYRVPKEERKARRQGREVRKLVRKLTKEEKAWVQARVDLIVNGRQVNAWGYPGNPPPNTEGVHGGDLSNTQYALLGMKAATRCGVKIDADVWLKILRIVLGAQEKDGPRVKLVVSRDETKEGYGRSYARPANVRGWRYTWPFSYTSGRTTHSRAPDPNDKPSGSMTCAGISCLAICHSELYRNRKYRSRMREVEKGINDGFAWLNANWSVIENPGGSLGWHYYYLYGLERAGVLADRKWIGEHDWYREGAEYFLSRQSMNGSWGDVVQTSFALLFLKRSTMPVTLTGLK
jgi:hypothetical protein